MKKLPVYLSLALAVASLAACEKELEEVAQPVAKTESAVQQNPQQLLVASQWRMTDLSTTSQVAGAAQSTTVSLFARLKPALRDNLTQFTTDGRYVLDEGASKVNPQVAQQKNGTYELSADAKTLTVKLPDYERRYTVEELSANTLRLKFTEGEGAAAVSYLTTYSQ